uniref:SRCR domain-containing protein n=1 Tax=Amphimedon queenslandica TaxID=400682 RepID=A0A1X7SQ24_AMPQE
MVPGVVLVSLLSLVLVYSAAGLECRIYVSSSDGINNTSCWTGGVQTPCATVDLAIQGTATLQYNCSSGILINLSPGTYTLDTTSLLEQQLLRNNVSITGMRDGSRYEEVSITCLHVSSSSYNWLRYIVFECVSLYNCNNVPVTCTEPSFDITTHNEPVLGDEAVPNYELELDDIDTSLYCYDYYRYNCICNYLSFDVYINDIGNKKQLGWTYGLKVCISINSSTDPECCNILKPNCSPSDRCYKVDKCFNDYIGAGPIEALIYIETLYLFDINTSRTVNVTTECSSGYNFVNGRCNALWPTCDIEYHMPCLSDGNSCKNNGYCYDNVTRQPFSNCTSKGVPLNPDINICTECDDYGLLIFIVIEILPITIMVLLIIIFNIQLTNGSINGVVFYSQITSIS